MARSITGPRMQARFLDVLEARRGTVVLVADLCRKLRLNTADELHQLAAATREQRKKGGGELPADAWGVGYYLGRLTA